MASETDKVVSNLRACIISSPTATLASDLNRDYRSLVGENIPFKKLGFPTLKDFLLSLPVFEVVEKCGDCYVQARATSGSSHIADLVRGQKKTSKKVKTRKSLRASWSHRPSSFNGTRFQPPSSQVPHFLQGPQTPLEASKQKARYNDASPSTATIPSSNGSSSHSQTSNPPILAQSPSQWNPPPAPPSQPIRKPQTPLAMRGDSQTRPSVKPSQNYFKKTVGDRLKVHKSEAKSEASFANGGARDANSSETCAPEVKWVDPVSRKSKKISHKVCSESGVSALSSFKLVDVQPSEYDKVSCIFKLIRYADDHNWPKPEFFVLNRRSGPSRRSESRYMSRVSVNCTPIGSKPSGQQDLDCYEFSSYPEEFLEMNLAMSYVAKKAYEVLLEKAAIKLPETSNYDLMLSRVSEMVKGKDRGIWLNEVEKMYKEQFNECLPGNFPQLMEKSISIEISKLAESYYIVRPKIMEVSSKFFSPNYVSHLAMNKLTLPDEDTWEVFVSRVKSLNEIYIKIIGEQYSDLYEAVAEEMDSYYLDKQDPSHRVCDVEIGKHYALVTNEEEPCVFRVLVIGYSDSDLYQAYLIDVGDVDVIEASSLRVLQPKFFQLPGQAIPCFLEGLEDYDFAVSSTEMNNYVCQTILGKSFAGLISNREPVRITLYDTSTNDDVNINCCIKKVVDSSFRSPDIVEEGAIKQIIVSTVDQNGQVYVQMPSWTLRCLNHKIALISNGYFEVSYLRDVRNVRADKIYFWSNGPCRVRVLKVLDELQVDVVFIDIGGQNSVPISELYEVDHLADLLPKIPPQAVPVLLNGVGDGTLKPNEISKFLDVVNSNAESSTIGKVIRLSNGVPVLEIFIRSETSNLLVSVNQNLTFTESHQLGDSQSSLNGTSYAPSCSTMNPTATGYNMSSDSALPSSSILPKVGVEWAIYVTGIANPHNFMVTPVDYLGYLNQLTEEMFVFYSSASTNTVCKPQNGECVAALIEGSWYRVQIDTKIDTDCYVGKYLDRGHMDTFPSNTIRALPEKFKKLPYLAFKAQLHGIKPINKDWNVSDCLRIKELIQNKKFISVIRDIINEPSGQKLSLEIIDTSTAEDVYISRQFIIEKRALPAIRI